MAPTHGAFPTIQSNLCAQSATAQLKPKAKTEKGTHTYPPTIQSNRCAQNTTAQLKPKWGTHAAVTEAIGTQ